MQNCNKKDIEKSIAKEKFMCYKINILGAKEESNEKRN